MPTLISFPAPPPKRPCAVSLNTTESAQIMLDLVRSNVDAGDEARAIDYLERATMMLLQELKLARKIRRGLR